MLIIVAGTRTDGSCPSWVNRYRNATCALRRFPLDSNHIADAPTCRTKYGSPRLFQEHGKWCNPQSASCQWDVPKSCKLRAAPVPSAAKHCAIRSILVLRPWTDAYVCCLRRNAFSQHDRATVEIWSQRNRRRRTRSMEQARVPSPASQRGDLR